MLDKIVISSNRSKATVHFDTHSVDVSSDKDVADLVHELFIAPQQQYQRSLDDTAIITLPTLEE